MRTSNGRSRIQPSHPRASLRLALLLVVSLVMPALCLGSRAHADDVTYGIEGTISDVGGAPLSGIHVTVWTQIPGLIPPTPIQIILGVGETDETGAYHVDLTRTGAGWGPWVCFWDQTGKYASECYDDQFENMPWGTYLTPVRVQPNTVMSGIDATLEPAASIAGQVTTADKEPAVDTEVTMRVVSPLGAFVRTVRTDATGRYVFWGLRSGTYVVKFHHPESGIDQYWRGQSSEAEATPLVVTAGASMNSIDATIDNKVTNTVVPSITGTAQVGQTLTASPGSWTPDDTAVRYRWVVGSDLTTTAGATGNTYVPSAADVGQPIRVRATGTRPGWVDGSAWSLPTAAVASAPPAAPPAGPKVLVRPRIKGVLRSGHIVWVSRGRWQPPSVVLRYQWYAGGDAIQHATHRRLHLKAGHVGKRLRVRITATATAHTRAIVWTRPSTRVRP